MNAGSPNRNGGGHNRNLGHSNKKARHTNKDGSITVFIIGQRRFELARDFLQVETRKVKANYMSVIDWLSQKT
jgi:hypothetical protein